MARKPHLGHQNRFGSWLKVLRRARPKAAQPNCCQKNTKAGQAALSPNRQALVDALQKVLGGMSKSTKRSQESSGKRCTNVGRAMLFILQGLEELLVSDAEVGMLVQHCGSCPWTHSSPSTEFQSQRPNGCKEQLPVDARTQQLERTFGHAFQCCCQAVHQIGSGSWPLRQIRKLLFGNNGKPLQVQLGCLASERDAAAAESLRKQAQVHEGAEAQGPLHLQP